jgi:hypothetical protein
LDGDGEDALKKSSTLASGAPIGRSVAQRTLANRSAAATADRPGASINGQFLAKVARVSFDILKVLQCRPPGGNGGFENGPNTVDQPIQAMDRNRSRLTERMNTCSMQSLTGVNVSDTNHHTTIHNQ